MKNTDYIEKLETNNKEKKINILKIYSSNNIVTYERPIELIGVCLGIYGKISLPKITWHLEPEIDGVKIENDYLIVNKTVKEGTEIIVCGKTSDKNLIAKKKNTS